MTVVTTLSQRRRVVSGFGALGALPVELALLGVTRTLVACGRNVAASPVLPAVLDALGERLVAVFDECTPHARLDTVDRIVDAVRAADADSLVCVGGGSAIDAAKGASILAGAGGRLEDAATRFEPPDRYVVPPLAGARVPVIALPTTLSASEATISAGFTDAALRRKIVVVDPCAPVRSVILDPESLLTTPARVLAASAGNALNHGIEAVTSRGHGALTDGLAVSAIRLLHGSIAAALAGDVSAAARCQAGAHLSGQAMPSTGLGIAHATAHAVGAYGASHGGANAVMAVHGLRFNRGWLGDQQRVLDEAFGTREGGAADALAAVLELIGAPADLRALGIEKSDLAAIAEQAYADRHIYANPRPVARPAEIEQLLLEAW